MKINPYISIVVCSYNEDENLEQCIGSLLQQNYPSDKYEIVLIDDGSTDQTADICRKSVRSNEGKYPSITYALIDHSGLAVGRNTGVFLSKGDIVAFIDGDAIADEHWLSEIAKAFDCDEEIAVVGGRVTTLNKKSWFAVFIHWIHYYMEDRSGNEIINIIGTNMAFKKEVFEKVNGFFEQFISRGDENSFINIKVLTSFKRNVTRSAVVYHVRPWGFGLWLKERFCNGHEYALVYYILRQYKRSNIKHNCYAIFRMLCFAFPYLLFAGVFFDWMIITIVGLISLFCFIYRSFWRDNIFIKAKILKREYGLFRSIFLFPLAAAIIGAGKMNDDYGFVRGLWKYRRTKVSDEISDYKIMAVENNIEKSMFSSNRCESKVVSDH